MKRFLIIAMMTLAACFASTAAPAPETKKATPADTAATLSPALREEIRAQVGQAMADEMHDGELAQIIAARPRILKDLTAIVFVGGGFTMVCLIVLIIAVNGTRRRRAKYTMVEKAIENGYTLPEYVFYDAPKTKQQSRSLNQGLVLVAVGLGLVLFFAVDGDHEMSALMSMLVFLGAGKLVTYFLDERQARRNRPTLPPPVPDDENRSQAAEPDKPAESNAQQD